MMSQNCYHSWLDLREELAADRPKPKKRIVTIIMSLCQLAAPIG